MLTTSIEDCVLLHDIDAREKSLETIQLNHAFILIYTALLSGRIRSTHWRILKEKRNAPPIFQSILRKQNNITLLCQQRVCTEALSL